MSNYFLKEKTMKNAFVTTALVLTAALSASASFAAYSVPQNRLNNVETSSFFAKSAPSVRSRAEVKTDFLEAQKAGTLPAMGEGATVFEKSVPSNLSRAAVKAEYLQAQKAGTLPAMGDRG